MEAIALIATYEAALRSHYSADSVVGDQAAVDAAYEALIAAEDAGVDGVTDYIDNVMARTEEIRREVVG